MPTTTASPYRSISLGAGVQSTVLLLLACAGELPHRPDVAIFADTGWEPKQVYQHLDWLEQISTIPIYRTQYRDLRRDTINGVSHSDHPFLDIPHYITTADGETRMSIRQCTTNYKVKPIIRLLRQLAGYPHPGPPPPPDSIHQWLGITTEEVHRVRDANRRFLRNCYPLLDLGMSRQDCIAWFQERYPGQPLAKSACVGCPFHSDRHWLEIYRRGGPEWDDTIAIDERLRAPDFPGKPTGRLADAGAVFSLHRKGPLVQVIPALDQEQRQNPKLPGLDSDQFGSECTGYCRL